MHRNNAEKFKFTLGHRGNEYEIVLGRVLLCDRHICSISLATMDSHTQ